MLGKTLRELVEDLGEDELCYWIAANNIEALPDPWAQTGVTCAVIAQAMGGSQVKPEDFIPHKPKRVSAAKAIKAIKALWHRSG